MDTDVQTTRDAASPPARGRAWRDRLRPAAQWQADLWMTVGVAVLVVVLGVGVPYVATSVLLGVLILATSYALLAMGTNILVGWSGLLTFGQAAFFGGGAYCVALMRDWPASPPVKLLIAGAVTAVAGLVLFTALARFTHITFAMLTLVAGMLVYLVAFRTPLVGGETGLAPVPRGEIGGFSIATNINLWLYAMAVLGVVGLFYWRFHRSMFTLRLMAIRDDETRAASLGLNIVAARAVAGAVAAGVSGVGGGLYAQYAGAVSPAVLYFEMSGAAVFMCLLGGARYLWGPLIGGVLYAVGAGYFLQGTTNPELYIGLAFMLLIVLLPGGLLSIWSRVRTWRRPPPREIPR